MGGSKTVGQNEANAQNAKNAEIQAENDRRLERQARSNNEIRYKSDNKQYDIDKKSYRTKAGMDAQGKVTNERADLIKSSSKLLTDFETQERTRLMRARKGQGQVRGKDEAITGDNRDEAIRKLALGDDYWSSRRQVAYDKAFGASEGQWDKDNARPELELTESQIASRERGRNYNRAAQPVVEASARGRSIFGSRDNNRSATPTWMNGNSNANTNKLFGLTEQKHNQQTIKTGASAGGGGSQNPFFTNRGLNDKVGINPGKPGIK